MDPVQDLHQRINHEARHCLGAFWFGREVKEIDVLVNCDGIAGHVVHAPLGELWIPDDLPPEEIGRWFDEKMAEERLARAVMARLGAGNDLRMWLFGEAVAHDRETVAQLCPPGTDADLWMHVIVENYASRLLGDKNFNAALTNLAVALFREPRPPWTGQRAYDLVSRFLP